MKILENEDNSIIVGKSNDDYILKYQNDFYKMKKKDFEQICDEEKLTFREEIKENPIYAMIMVGIIITTIPSAIIFFLMQKSFVDSMMGSVK